MTDSLTGSSRPLRVAIVGAGPGGLAAAIALNRVANIDLHVFEQARVLREIGAGIGINENTWRLLKWYGADQNMEAFYKTRKTGVLDLQMRDGRTGELISERLHNEGATTGPPYARVERYKLQNALLKEVPPGLIQLRKRLADVKQREDGRLTLHFEDGTTFDDVDLLVGADGIRSVVRKFAFPEHKISYSGKVAYRVLIPQTDVAHIPGIPPCATFWHTPTTHVYTCFLDEGKFEIATRALESEEHGNKVSWGQEASTESVIKHYDEYCDTIRAILAAPKEYQQYALFGGPRLDTVIARGRVALIGDASHPLSGAFGAGAAFALEDAYTLKAALEYARTRSETLSYALTEFDETRSPHYKSLYHILDSYGAINKELFALDPPLSAWDLVRIRLERNQAAAPTQWIYKHDITKVWQARIDAKERQRAAVDKSRPVSGNALDHVVADLARVTLVPA